MIIAYYYTPFFLLKYYSLETNCPCYCLMKLPNLETCQVHMYQPLSPSSRHLYSLSPFLLVLRSLSLSLCEFLCAPVCPFFSFPLIFFCIMENWPILILSHSTQFLDNCCIINGTDLSSECSVNG